MSERVRFGIAVVYLFADTEAGWEERVLVVLHVYGLSEDEAKEALRLSGLECIGR